VARTRTEIDRDAKVDEILAAAERRLRDGGYPALSVAAIARDLGLAQNAIYWYFPSKDHLFVAALERLLRGVVAAKPPARGSAERRILWFVDRLAELEDVRAAMRERARESPVVGDFAAELDATWRRMLAGALAGQAPEDELPDVVDALLAVIQGVLARNATTAERRRTIAFALERLVPATGHRV
jgi:TetR/AcrR family transcriptional regulator, cholesterol catabolism regulator